MRRLHGVFLRFNVMIIPELTVELTLHPRSSESPVSDGMTRSAAASQVRRIVILKWDSLHAQALKRLCQETFPSAEVEIHRCAATAVEALVALPSDLTLTGLTFEERDVFTLLEPLRRHSFRLLVVSGRQDNLALLALRSVRFDGFFDPHSDDPEQLPEVMARVMEGEYVVGEKLRPRLHRSLEPDPLRHWLTPTELQVLCVIGDGSTNDEAAAQMNLSPLTVQTHRRAIMRKLNVSTSAKLVLAAIRLGVIRVNPDGRKIAAHFRRRDED